MVLVALRNKVVRLRIKFIELEVLQEGTKRQRPLRYALEETRDRLRLLRLQEVAHDVWLLAEQPELLELLIHLLKVATDRERFCL